MHWAISPAQSSWLNSRLSSTSTCHHQQWQNNCRLVKPLCACPSSSHLCVLLWSHGIAFVLLRLWPSSVRSMHSLRKASFYCPGEEQRSWNCYIWQFLLQILYGGYISAAEKIQKTFPDVNLSNKRRNVIKVYFLEFSALFKDEARPHSSHSLSFMVIVSKVKWAANIFTIVLYYLDR